MLAGLILGLLPQTTRGEAQDASAEAIRVALYLHKDNSYYGRGNKNFRALLSAEEGFAVTNVTADDIKSGKLMDFHVLIMPGGSGSAQGKALGEAGREVVREFVRNGGGFVGVCAGAYLASSDYSWSLNIINAKVLDRKHWARGKGQVTLALTPDSKKLLGHAEDEVEVRYAQGPLYAPNDTEGLPAYEELATFLTEVSKEGVPGGVMPGKTAMARATFGDGRVLACSPHPESPGGPGHLIVNAVRWAAKASK